MSEGGTGLHKYWYLRLIALLLTVVLPLGLLFWAIQTPAVEIGEDAGTIVWICFGWLLFVLIVVLSELKLESFLEKKNNSDHIHINNVNMDPDATQAFNNVFKQFDQIFQSMNPQANDTKSNLCCPKCGSKNVAKMKTGSFICLDCECKFSLHTNDRRL